VPDDAPAMHRLGFRIERNLRDQLPGTVLGILENYRLKEVRNAYLHRLDCIDATP